MASAARIETPPFFAGAILSDRSGFLLLQWRDDKPGIHARGKIGPFGGGGRPAESYREAAVRELGEELGLTFRPQDLTLLLETETLLETGAHVPTRFFGCAGVETSGLTVMEGRLIRIAPGGLIPWQRMTPTCRRAVRLFLSANRSGPGVPEVSR